MPNKNQIISLNKMTDNKKECDLCGLSVEIPDFSLKTKEGDKVFCCEGCKGIYQLLNEVEILPEPDMN